MPVTGLPGGDGTGEPLLLWSAEPAAADGRSNVLLWQGNPMAANQRSLVAYLEAHAEEIRRRYLAWVHDLGETAVLGRRLLNVVIKERSANEHAATSGALGRPASRRPQEKASERQAAERRPRSDE